jgi:hypothetical protein
MKKSILGCILVLVVIIAFVMNVNLKANDNSLSAIGLANVEALANEEGGFATNYNRHPFTCTIYGNGKVRIVGGNILEVKGSLSFDGGLYCSAGGTYSCTPAECTQLWQWIFE